MQQQQQQHHQEQQWIDFATPWTGPRRWSKEIVVRVSKKGYINNIMMINGGIYGQVLL